MWLCRHSRQQNCSDSDISCRHCKVWVGLQYGASLRDGMRTGYAGLCQLLDLPPETVYLRVFLRQLRVPVHELLSERVNLRLQLCYVRADTR